MKYVAVFFGGVSQEHDVSVLTGVLTLNCLDKERYIGVPVYVDREGKWFTGDALGKVSFFKRYDEKKLVRVSVLCGEDALYAKKGGSFKKICDVYCAINCLHGRNGEDGSLAGVMRMCKIPFASPDLFSASASMDKCKTKLFLNALGVKNVPFAEITKREFFTDSAYAIERVRAIFGYPAIVKPAKSGSSIGITVAKDDGGLIDALNKAFSYDESCVVERFLAGANDVNCAAFKKGAKILVSECERPLTRGEFLSFADKYTSTKYGAQREFPAKIEKSASDEIKKITEKVYKAFGFCGIIRVDYLLYDGEIYLNEINSSPGSLAYYLFCDKFAEFSKILDDVIRQGVEERVSYDNCSFEFSSDILSFEGISLKK